ncbi:MAG TPA: hypothetical protein PLV68_05270, partial [Ilumatobacteraceae bacterium]|nr:hypothetical protein [Ilumatobacteraceae bacterium]
MTDTPSTDTPSTDIASTDAAAPTPRPLRVVIADDQALVRSGFRMILEAQGVTVVGEAGDGKTAVAIARET